MNFVDRQVCLDRIARDEAKTDRGYGSAIALGQLGMVAT